MIRSTLPSGVKILQKWYANGQLVFDNAIQRSAVNGVFYKRACSSIVFWQATQYRQCSCLNIRMTMPPYMIASRASRDCLTHSVLCLGSMRYMAVLQT